MWPNFPLKTYVFADHFGKRADWPLTLPARRWTPRGPGRGLQPGFQPGETPAPPPADRTPSAPVGPGRRPRAGQVCHPGPACHRRRPKTASRVGTRPRAGRGGPGSGPGRSGGIVGGGGGPGSRPGRSGAKSRRGTTACRAEGRGPRPTARTTPPAERAAPPAAPSRVRTPPPRSPRAVYAVRGRLARDSRASRGTPGPGAASGRGHGAPAGWRAGGPIFRRERRGPARSPSGTFATLLAFLGLHVTVASVPPRPAPRGGGGGPASAPPLSGPAPTADPVPPPAAADPPHSQPGPAPSQSGPAHAGPASRASGSGLSARPRRPRPALPLSSRGEPRSRHLRPAQPLTWTRASALTCALPGPAPSSLRVRGKVPSLALTSTTETGLTKTNRL